MLLDFQKKTPWLQNCNQSNKSSNADDYMEYSPNTNEQYGFGNRFFGSSQSFLDQISEDAKIFKKYEENIKDFLKTNKEIKKNYWTYIESNWSNEILITDKSDLIEKETDLQQR